MQRRAACAVIEPTVVGLFLSGLEAELALVEAGRDRDVGDSD